MIDLAQELTPVDDRRSDGDQPVLMQMIRVMLDQNRSQHQSRQKMRKEMIDQNKEIYKQTLKLMELV